MSDLDRLRIVFALAADDLGEGDEPEGWQTVLEAGKVRFRAAIGGKVPTITTGMMNKWVEAFEARGREVPIDLHHATLTAAVKNDPRYLDPALSAARGWITKIRVVGEKLQALIKWTKEGAGFVRDGKFRFPSVEFDKDTIIGATLTNHPAADVPALALSQAAYDYLDAGAGGATVEPAKYPSARDTHHMEDPMDTKIAALAALLGCTEEEVEGKVSALKSGAETDTAVALAVADRDAKIAALAADLETHRDAEFTRELAERVFKDGRMKNEDKAIAALRTVYDADRDQFLALTAAMAAGTVPVRKPTGVDAAEPETTADNAAGAIDAGDKLHALATTLVTEDTDYSTAYALACEQKPAWVAAYETGDGRDI